MAIGGERWSGGIGGDVQAREQCFYGRVVVDKRSKGVSGGLDVGAEGEDEK